MSREKFNIVDKEIVEEFELRTKYPLFKFYEDFIDFNDNFSQNIFNYFLGELEEVTEISFQKLEKLLKEANKIIYLFQNNTQQLDTYKYWILLDDIEDIRTTLQSINNASRWLRSSISNVSFSSDPEFKYITGQNETLEKINKNIGSGDEENDWVEIALNNSLREEDYSNEGGLNLKVYLKNNKSIYINSVIDNINSDTIYGKDLFKKITYKDNDLETLSPIDTLKQSVEILANLNKNDNPAFKNLGIDKSLIIGKNFNSVSYPAITRQLFSTFKTDDTLASFTILNIEQKTNSIKISYLVETVLFEPIEGQI